MPENPRNLGAGTRKDPKMRIGAGLRATAIVGLATVVMAACSPGQESTNASSGGTIDPASFEGKTLDYAYFTDGPDEEATRKLIEKFEQETGAKVNLQLVPFESLEQTLQARVNSGNPPEVARVTAWQPYADVLLDFKGYFGDDYPGQFLDGLAQAGSDSEGAFRAVPSDLTMNGPLVNVDAFEKAGVPLPTEEDPWSWEEMIAAAVEVQQANDMQFGFVLDKSGNRISTMLSEYGTTFFDEEGNVAFDETMAGAALGDLNDLMQQDVLSKDFWLQSGSKYAGGNEMFLAGQVPVYLSGNWQVAQFADTASFQWAAVPNPCEERCGGFPGGKYMVAFNDSDEPELGAYFVEWMNRQQNQRQMDEMSSWLPTRQDLVDAGVDYPTRPEDMKVFLQGVSETPADAFATNGHPQFTAAATVLLEEMDKMVAGQQSVDDTVGAVRDELDQLAEDQG
jgi:alpha-1,4-digalacturonate transport system substrate-binding protein